jgi:hypothetical protein
MERIWGCDFKKIIHFSSSDFQATRKDLRPFQAFLVRFLLSLSGHSGFIKADAAWASALTLLLVLPSKYQAGKAFGFAKGFGLNFISKEFSVLQRLQTGHQKL